MTRTVRTMKEITMTTPAARSLPPWTVTVHLAAPLPDEAVGALDGALATDRLVAFEAPVPADARQLDAVLAAVRLLRESGVPARTATRLRVGRA